jgi:hypothetical protein
MSSMNQVATINDVSRFRQSDALSEPAGSAASPFSLAQDELETPLPPLRSVHTTNFPRILDRLGASVFVTTYQAGKLVMLRAEGEVLNTHFCRFK